MAGHTCVRATCVSVNFEHPVSGHTFAHLCARVAPRCSILCSMATWYQCIFLHHEGVEAQLASIISLFLQNAICSASLHTANIRKAE